MKSFIIPVAIALCASCTGSNPSSQDSQPATGVESADEGSFVQYGSADLEPYQDQLDSLLSSSCAYEDEHGQMIPIDCNEAMQLPKGGTPDLQPQGSCGLPCSVWWNSGQGCYFCSWGTKKCGDVWVNCCGGAKCVGVYCGCCNALCCSGPGGC